MIQRVVFFKFKEGTTEDTLRQHNADLRGLKNDIPQILSYSAGKCVPERGKVPNYDGMHLLTFENMEEVDVYFFHPAHQKFIEKYHDIWADVISYNAVIE